MKTNKTFSLRARGESFGFAFNGIKTFLQQEHNAILHAVATMTVVVLAILFPVSKVEVILLVFSVAFVWVAEIFNTAIEKTMDFISIERKPQIKYIKDLSAAAVLLAACTALIVGGIVFIPKF